MGLPGQRHYHVHTAKEDPMSVAPRQTSALAVVSLVMGIASWTVLPFVASIVAIITGHMARAEIRRRPHELPRSARQSGLGRRPPRSRWCR